jgi:uncharacterized membrane protein (GlpM family)
MSGGPENERSFREAPPESIEFEPGNVKSIKKRDLAVRFAFGAGASILAGAVTLATNSRIGGVFLAFPAILAASLTLIDEEDGSPDAREDARGAVVGAVALAAFATTCVALLNHLNAALVLAAATVVWAAVAVGLYLILWRPRRRTSSGPRRSPAGGPSARSARPRSARTAPR